MLHCAWTIFRFFLPVCFDSRLRNNFCERRFVRATNTAKAMVASSESKRHRFAVQVRPPPRRVKVTQTKDVVLGPRFVEPPAEVAAKLRASHLVIGFDIETHDLLGRHMKWWVGP